MSSSSVLIHPNQRVQVPQKSHLQLTNITFEIHQSNKDKSYNPQQNFLIILSSSEFAVQLPLLIKLKLLTPHLHRVHQLLLSTVTISGIHNCLQFFIINEIKSCIFRHLYTCKQMHECTTTVKGCLRRKGKFIATCDRQSLLQHS